MVVDRSTQVGGPDNARPARVELGNKGIGSPAAGAAGKSTGDGEIGRSGHARHVHVPGVVDRNAIADIAIRSTEVGGPGNARSGSVHLGDKCIGGSSAEGGGEAAGCREVRRVGLAGDVDVASSVHRHAVDEVPFVRSPEIRSPTNHRIHHQWQSRIVCPDLESVLPIAVAVVQSLIAHGYLTSACRRVLIAGEPFLANHTDPGLDLQRLPILGRPHCQRPSIAHPQRAHPGAGMDHKAILHPVAPRFERAQQSKPKHRSPLFRNRRGLIPHGSALLVRQPGLPPPPPLPLPLPLPTMPSCRQGKPELADTTMIVASEASDQVAGLYPKSPSQNNLNSLAADPSRLAASLVGFIPRVCALLAPCHPGGSSPILCS
ncbi:MAG: hypothetical protein V2A73_12890, partial [Pseudomonadota bacterium]